jgi:hypothetical protein
MFRTSCLALALFVCVAGLGFAAQDQFSPNEEGYIRNWLILAPLPLDDGQDGSAGNNKAQIPHEENLKPKEGDKVTFKDKQLTWKKCQAKEDFVDFNDFLGAQTEDCVGYAVCYLVCPEEMTGLNLKMGSDDQAKVFLNGKEVLKNDTARMLTKDEDTAENVTLKKGQNVLVFKVVNEKIDFSGSIRFLTKNGEVVRNFKVALTPE